MRRREERADDDGVDCDAERVRVVCIVERVARQRACAR
jgi:hypothetical protein